MLRFSHSCGNVAKCQHISLAITIIRDTDADFPCSPWMQCSHDIMILVAAKTCSKTKAWKQRTYLTICCTVRVCRRDFHFNLSYGSRGWGSENYKSFYGLKPGVRAFSEPGKLDHNNIQIFQFIYDLFKIIENKAVYPSLCARVTDTWLMLYPECFMVKWAHMLLRWIIQRQPDPPTLQWYHWETKERPKSPTG